MSKKPRIQKPKSALKLRRNNVKRGFHLPEPAQILLAYYASACQKSGRVHVEFEVPDLPLSANHQYDRGRAVSKTGKVFQRSILKEGVLDFRDLLTVSMGPAKYNWKPTGLVACVVIYESRHWVRQNNQVAAKDVDNVLKPLLDAVQTATWVPDEHNWHEHIFKVQSSRDATTVYLFDLGDVVTCVS